MPSIDLDSDRPSVLDRLLAIRAADAAAARALADVPEEGAEGGSAAGAASAKSTLRETPSPVVVRVPVPAPARHSLVSVVGATGKEGLRRIKPPALGERDQNNPARRLAPGGATRRVTKSSLTK